MIIALSGLIVASGCVLFFYSRKQFGIAQNKEVEELRHKYEETVSLYVNVLHDKVTILDQYVGDYFNSISESEYPQLKQIDESLQKLTNECYEYLLKGDPNSVEQLIGFLEGRPMVVSARIQQLTSVNLHIVNEWRRKAQEHLISAVLALKRTSTHNQVAEIQRNRNRMETEDMLNEIIRWSFPNSQ